LSPFILLHLWKPLNLFKHFFYSEREKSCENIFAQWKNFLGKGKRDEGTGYWSKPCLAQTRLDLFQGKASMTLQIGLDFRCWGGLAWVDGDMETGSTLIREKHKQLSKMSDRVSQNCWERTSRKWFIELNIDNQNKFVIIYLSRCCFLAGGGGLDKRKVDKGESYT
jgi:hypothetical protein